MKEFNIKVIFTLFALSLVCLAADDVDSLVVSFSNPSQPGTVKAEMMMGGIKVRTHTGRDVIIISLAKTKS